jgi:hypothetical protein
VLKQGFLPRKGFSPKFAGLIRGIFSGPRTELKSAKMRDLIEEGYWKLEAGLDHHK